MTLVQESSKSTARDSNQATPAPFFVRGKLVAATETRHRSRDLGVDFVTPQLDLDALITLRTEPGPLFDVKLNEILDFLAETGERMRLDRGGYLREAVDRIAATNVLPRSVIEHNVRMAADYLNKAKLLEYAEQNLGNARVLDEWLPRVDSTGRRSFTRAFPPRLIHVLPGNSPLVSAQSIALGAMVKAVNLFKMGSSDPFMAVAILRTMLDVDPDHPVPRSMSAVYWRGGDEQVERAIFQPQYFDKIVAWGGGDAINNVIKYLMPGLQLVSFDPKTSISMIGIEAFDSVEVLEDVATRAANDVGLLNQEACVCSRVLFVEGDRRQVDRFCERLQRKLVERNALSGKAPPLPRDLAEEVDSMRLMDEEFGVWGIGDGSGLVVRSDEPVDFHPINKTANVVQVKSLR
ncbi:MAG TPA: acyl-CoA reductase, partial [Steroidobacteraceae bacterium]|nr:acyl-CoA reductase [Steroidobacteraceae bacterium]